LRRAAADLLHSPAYTLPPYLPVPSVVTIHDISYETHPEWYPYRGGALRRRWYRMAAACADHIITISDFSRAEILRAYHLPDEKVTRTYLGVDRRRFRRVADPQPLHALRQRYDLPDPFLLFVGDLHPRRNVRGIVRAFEILTSTGRIPKLALVLIGRTLVEEAVPALGQASAAHGIRRIGYVPEADLPLFYSSARLFLFPSFYEGFGLGVLEAMACGCPVVVGRGTACEEIAGDAVRTADSDDVGSIVRAAEELLLDPVLAASCVETGLKRASRFDWNKTAEETVAVYQRLLGA